MALNWDVPLTYILRRKEHQYVLNSWHGETCRKDGLDKRMFSCSIMKRNHCLTGCKIATMYTNLRGIQTKFLIMSCLQSKAQGKEKEMNVWYLSQLHIISSIWTKYCTKGIYLVFQNCCNRRMLRSISYASVSMLNFLLLLTILPAGSDQPSIPTTGWHLCCCLAILHHVLHCRFVRTISSIRSAASIPALFTVTRSQ